MVMVCAVPTHRLAKQSKCSLEDLAGENMISFDADLTIRHEIDRVLQLHQVEVKVVMEFDNIETMKRAIEIDAGISLLPEPTVLREVEVGSLVAVPLDTDELVRPLGIIHRRGKELSSTASGSPPCCKPKVCWRQVWPKKSQSWLRHSKLLASWRSAERQLTNGGCG